MGPGLEGLYAFLLPILPSSRIRRRVWADNRAGLDDAAKAKINRRLERWLVLSTVVLVIGIFTVNKDAWGWGVAEVWTVVVAVLAFFRICEIFSQSVEVISGKIGVDAPTTMATLVMYVIQGVAIFTICAELVGPRGFETTDAQPHSQGDFLYMTWNNMATLGNSSYTATSPMGRWVVTGSTVTAILLFSVLLGFAVGKLGGPMGRVTELEQLLAISQRALGPDHPDAVRIHNSLAFKRGESGDAAEAITELEQLLAISQRVVGPDHPDTLRIRNGLAFCIRNSLAFKRGKSGNAAQAITELEQLLAISQRVVGPNHPNTLRIRNSLAFKRGESGDAAQAITELEQLLAISQRVVGPNHPDTLQIRTDLDLLHGRAQ